MKEEKVLAYHFTNGMKLRDGQELIEGKTYIHDGPIEICKSGLHASRRVIDALQYAPNGTLSIVECSGVVEEHRDKFVCRERKVLETHEVTRLLQDFALDVAEEAVRKHYNIEGDTRPQDAIRIARLCLEGKATLDQLEEACGNAYKAAASDASVDRYAAYYTTRAAYYASKHAIPASFFINEAVYFPYFAYPAVDCASTASNGSISEYNSQLTERLQKVFKISLGV